MKSTDRLFPATKTTSEITVFDLASTFKNEVNDRAMKIDPNQEYDWLSLTIGWALAKGLNPKPAREFATYIRYETELG
jgi:hypothetical protein